MVKNKKTGAHIVSMEATWKPAARAFFDRRASEISGVPTLEDLCYVSGRDTRLWGDPEVLDDLARSIAHHCAVNSTSSLLEVGCASGFLATIVAPIVGRYIGVDLAEQPLHTARRLSIPNATFRKADGTKLPFPKASFDAALCYDVFINLPNFDAGAPIIAEMLRVVKPGGRVVVGSVPDEAFEPVIADHVAKVSAHLDGKYGPPNPRPQSPLPLETRSARLLRKIGIAAPNPNVVCYYFRKDDFLDLAEKLDCRVTIFDVHPMNPYAGIRFNAVFVSP